MESRLQRTAGYFDTATLGGAMLALDRAQTDKWTKWDIESALTATYLLLNKDIKTTPGPGSFRGVYGLIEEFISVLGDLTPTFDPDFRAVADRKTAAWLNRHPDSLKSAYKKLQEEHTESLEAWLDRVRRIFWVDHSRMLDGLFDEQYIPQLSGVMNTTKQALKSVYARSRNVRTVRCWVKNPACEEASIAAKAYVLGSIARGKFHQHVGKELRCHFASHPLRAGVIRTRRVAEATEGAAAMEFFVRILIGSARQERTLKRRVQVWANNLKKARGAIAHLNLSEKTLGSRAEEQAAKAAGTIGLPATARNVERFLRWGPPVALTVMAHFVSSPWLGTAAFVTGLPVLHKTSRHGLGTLRYKALGRMIPGALRLRLYDPSRNEAPVSPA